MNEQALVRLQRLLSLKMGAQELSDTVGGRYSYWRGMLHGEKSFGEKIARKVEEKLSLPRGWLDENDKPMEAAPQKEADSSLGLSASAIELAKLFDMLPDDRIKRTIAYSAATAEILKVLQGRGD